MFLALAIAGAVNSASAFSLLGPFDTWQIAAINYNPVGNDIGGPMNLGEEYRWNVKTITYGFDSSFMNYFGAQGTAAVMQAIAILNNLPAMSQLSTNLVEFPLDTRRQNYQASALGLNDLKSTALSLLLEEMGLASPERYVWTLRSRLVFSNPSYTNYVVIKRNFDPITLTPSSYVNGTLYSYYIYEYTLFPSGHATDAREFRIDPLAFTFTAVVSAADGYWGGGLNAGDYFTGLTRDDVGGLRYLYGSSGRWANYNVENLIPGTTGSGSTSSSGGGSPWTPVGGGGGGTGTGVTNAVVDLAVRLGVDKIIFVYGKNDSTYGNFLTVTNTYTDTYVVDSSLQTQTTQRILTQPDILFAAADLGIYVDGTPILATRSANWVNNNLLNGQSTLAGPGQINPEVVITFSSLGPFIMNLNPYFNDEADPDNMDYRNYPWGIWGSFDGTTNPPVIYPNGTSIGDLEQQVFGN